MAKEKESKSKVKEEPAKTPDHLLPNTPYTKDVIDARGAGKPEPCVHCGAIETHRPSCPTVKKEEEARNVLVVDPEMTKIRDDGSVEYVLCSRCGAMGTHRPSCSRHKELNP